MRLTKVEGIGLSLLFVVTVFFSLFGLFYPDEGYILHTASRLLNGEVMYKAFHFVYTPLSAWIPATFFLVFGESIFVGRVSAVFVAFLSVCALYFLSRKYTKNILLRFFLPVTYLSWGFSHINFIWPSMVAISCGIFGCFFYLTQKGWKQYVFAGFFSGLSLLSKQNIGLSVCICFFILSLLFQNGRLKRNISGLFQFLGGAALVSVVFFLILFSQGALRAFWDNFYLNIFQKIVVEGTLNTPLVYGEGVYAWLKFFYYISPLLFSFPALYLCIKKRSPLMLLPVFCVFVYLAGIRPVTDYVHISPLMALSGLPLLPLFIFIRNKKIVFPLIFYAALVIFTGFYNPLFLYYYRWQEPILKQTNFVGGRAGIFLDDKYKDEIPELTTEINALSEKGTYIFINYYAPMVYFLLDRRNPTKYDYLSANAISEVEQQDIIKNLKEKNVQVALTHEIVKNDTSLSYQYIAKHFIKTKQVNDLIIWKRK